MNERLLIEKLVAALRRARGYLHGYDKSIDGEVVERPDIDEALAAAESYAKADAEERTWFAVEYRDNNNTWYTKPTGFKDVEAAQRYSARHPTEVKCIVRVDETRTVIADAAPEVKHAAYCWVTAYRCGERPEDDVEPSCTCGANADGEKT
jgi:hypothetical protein